MYIGKQPTIGNFQVCDAISTVNGQATYNLTVNSVAVTPETANHVLCSVNGILQKPGSSFSIVNSTIVFSANLVTGDVVDFVHILGSVLDLGVPSDDTVTAAKISANAVTGAKLNTDVISAQTALATEPADTDEFLVSDAGVLKRIDYSLIKGGGTHALVASSTITSNTSIVTLSGMDSTYNTYMVELENIVATSDNVQMGLRFTQGGSIIETNYQWFVARSGIAEGVINVHQHGDTSNIVFAHGVAGNNDPSVNGRIFIYNAPNTSMHTSIVASISLQHRDNHDHQLHHSHGEIQNNTASTAVSLRFSGGNIGSGVLKLYGVT